jgi:hypothetical protein
MRLGDHICSEDFELMRKTAGNGEISKRDWKFILTLIGLVIFGVLIQGCDSQAAEFTAKAEQEAHEKHETVMAWWYSHTYAPIKASQANVDITVCQNTDSTARWQCYAGAK